MFEFEIRNVKTNEKKTIWGSGSFRIVMKKRGLKLREWELISYEYVD